MDEREVKALKEASDLSLAFFQQALAKYLPEQELQQIMVLQQELQMLLASKATSAVQRLSLESAYWQELYLLWERTRQQGQQALPNFVQAYQQLQAVYRQKAEALV